MAGRLVGKPLIGELEKDAMSASNAGAQKTDRAAAIKLLKGMIANPEADFKTIAGKADVGVFHGQCARGLTELAAVFGRMRSVG